MSACPRTCIVGGTTCGCLLQSRQRCSRKASTEVLRREQLVRRVREALRRQQEEVVRHIRHAVKVLHPAEDAGGLHEHLVEHRLQLRLHVGVPPSPKGPHHLTRRKEVGGVAPTAEAGAQRGRQRARHAPPPGPLRGAQRVLEQPAQPLRQPLVRAGANEGALQQRPQLAQQVGGDLRAADVAEDVRQAVHVRHQVPVRPVRGGLRRVRRQQRLQRPHHRLDQ
eukprot:1195767-Prorocentrum_minimum.AAC.1